jgi:hypothetical protein
MKTVEKFWRRITTTRTARALEEEILPHMRAQEAEIARQREENERKGAEIEGQRAELERQRAKNDRLRAENRALLNSILGIAGIPPILVAPPPEALPGAPPMLQSAALPSGHGSSRADEGVIPAGAVDLEASATEAAGTGDSSTARLKACPDVTARQAPLAAPTPEVAVRQAQLATPTRRRSWHQIHRALELAAAQKIQVHEDSPA